MPRTLPSKLAMILIASVALALFSLTAWTEEEERTVMDCRDGDHTCPGECVPIEEVDCTSRPACGSRGQCSAIQNHGSTRYGSYVCDTWPVCGAANDDDCARSRGCFEGGRCQAGEARYYFKCNVEGPCYESIPNTCLPTDESCRASTQCETLGRCGLRATFTGKRCDPTQDSHCEESVACRETGTCAVVTLSPPICAPTADEHCARSADCRRYGRCALHRTDAYWIAPTCVAAEDAHCQDSEHCALRGLCTLDEGRCVATDEDDPR